MDPKPSLDENKLDKFCHLHLLEKHRIKSFKDWPFSEKSTCSISKMAEAGFFWTGSKRENDTATCFVCGKTLDGWESEDDPWKEHLKHAPQCEFVKLGCAEKDLTVEQFLKIFGIVVNSNIEKSLKQFKSLFVKDNEIKLAEFTKNQT